jgi:hypothetical protein
MLADPHIRFGEQGRRLRERGEALANQLFGRPVAELSRRETAALIEQLAAGPMGGAVRSDTAAAGPEA